MEHHLYSIDGTEVIRLANNEKILSLIKSSPQPGTTNLLGLLNVKYLISKFEIDSKEFELVKIVGDKDDPESSLRIYKNLNVLPRAFLVEEYKVLDSEKDYRDTLESKAFNPRNLVLLDKDPNSFPDRSKISNQSIQSNKHEKVIIRTYQPNKIELCVSVNKHKMLFLSETYYPGWKVYIDGNEGTIYRANYAFRAVPLNPGNHEVVFVYKPSSVILGGIITLVGIVATVLMLVGSTWIAALPISCRPKKSP